MKKALIIVLAIAALFALASCKTVKNGEDTAVLTLKSNPTTGCSWMVKVADENVAVVESIEYQPDENPAGMVGVGGVDHIKFKAVGAGSTTASLDYGHAWNPEEVYEKKTAQITVDSNLHITVELKED